MTIKKRGAKSSNPHPIFKTKLTLGQKAADLVTAMCGSWIFIIGLFIFMAIWMTMNVYMIVYKWDPYPFILLNFVLSCLAAVQAPIILMSQNRQTERDRMKLNYDYQINRKSFIEIERVYKEIKQIKELIKRKK
jgi:uncharacterized membrane protein